MRRMVLELALVFGLVFVGGCFNRPTEAVPVKEGKSALDRMKEKGDTQAKEKAALKKDKGISGGMPPPEN